jgi:flagellar motor switch protein FliN/FliY
MDKHQLISGFLDAFTQAISDALSETGPEDLRLAWSLTSSPANDAPADAETWTWWSGGLSTHPGANFFIGAPDETWEKLGRGGSSENKQEDASALVGRCFAKAVEEQFGGRTVAQDAGPSGAPTEDWTHISVEIRYAAGQWPNACCVLSPEFEAALTGPEKAEPAVAPVFSPASWPTGRTAQSDMLMHVQVPVSVSFGATQIRMKDLLNLTSGSVVELDQALHDNVEVRVNNRVIARGEVVAVDGHYGVRVLELVSGDSLGKGMKA